MSEGFHPLLSILPCIPDKSVHRPTVDAICPSCFSLFMWVTFLHSCFTFLLFFVLNIMKPSKWFFFLIKKCPLCIWAFRLLLCSKYEKRRFLQLSGCSAFTFCVIKIPPLPLPLHDLSSFHVSKSSLRNTKCWGGFEGEKCPQILSNISALVPHDTELPALKIDCGVLIEILSGR